MLHHPNFLVLSVSQVVSRSHVEFWEFKNEFFVVDVGSNSGTWLNGYRLSDPGIISPHFAVKNGDILRIGADFKATKGINDGSNDIRFKAILCRIFCRLPEIGNLNNNLAPKFKSAGDLSTPVNPPVTNYLSGGGTLVNLTDKSNNNSDGSRNLKAKSEGKIVASTSKSTLQRKSTLHKTIGNIKNNVLFKIKCI